MTHFVSRRKGFPKTAVTGGAEIVHKRLEMFQEAGWSRGGRKEQGAGSLGGWERSAKPGLRLMNLEALLAREGLAVAWTKAKNLYDLQRRLTN